MRAIEVTQNEEVKREELTREEKSQNVLEQKRKNGQAKICLRPTRLQ